MPSGLAPEVREFLYRHFESVDVLEALLAIFRSKDAWTPERLARELDLAEDEAMDILANLHYQGFLAHDAARAGYLFSPRDDGLGRGVAELARLPGSRVIAEIEAYVAPRSFADAFRIRPDRKKDRDG